MKCLMPATQYRGNVSLLLLKIISLKNNPFSLDYQCYYCFGILLDPVSCKYCQVSYCKSCINKLKKRNEFCFCKNFRIEKFIKKENPVLNETIYKFYRSWEYCEHPLKYKESINSINEILFWPSLSSDTNLEDKNNLRINLSTIENYSQEFNSKSFLPRNKKKLSQARLINFCYSKGIKFEI